MTTEELRAIDVRVHREVMELECHQDPITKAWEHKITGDVGMWRVTEWARSVVRHHPVMKIVLTDRVPWRVGARGNKPQRYTFGQDNGPYEYFGGPESLVPPILYAEYMKLEGDYWRYETVAAANDALATAAGALVRREVWGES